MSLPQWANNGWLRPHQTSAKEVQDLLAIVIVDSETADPRYVRVPFQREPVLAVTRVNHNLAELLARGNESG